MLALIKLRDILKSQLSTAKQNEIQQALLMGGTWLTGLQNSDGGFPTFCRGWGNLPFDRSANDITAHCIRALTETKVAQFQPAVQRGKKYLFKNQNGDGSWLPLWFGNQFNHDDENPVFGTSRVLMAFSKIQTDLHIEKAVGYLLSQQNEDGGWGGAKYIDSTVEETSLAISALKKFLPADHPSLQQGLTWLIKAVETNKVQQAAPVGFYFAKLWYYEKLYPLIFAMGALNSDYE